MQSFFESVRPCFRIAALLGTQYQKEAFRVVPPISEAFSRTITSSPSQRANNAADRPPAPLPTTTMSTSASKAFGCAGAAERRLTTAFEPDMGISTLDVRRDGERARRRVLPIDGGLSPPRADQSGGCSRRRRSPAYCPLLLQRWRQRLTKKDNYKKRAGYTPVGSGATTHSSVAVRPLKGFRRRAKPIPESHGHMLLRREASGKGDFGNRRAGLHQELAGILQSALNDELVQGASGADVKLPPERRDRQIHGLGKIGDAERLAEVLFDIGYEASGIAAREDPAMSAFAKRADALHGFGEGHAGERFDAQPIASVFRNHRGPRIGDQIGDRRREDVVDATRDPRHGRVVAEIILAKRRREREGQESAADLARADCDLAALGMKRDALRFKAHRRRARAVIGGFGLDRAEQQADDVRRVAKHQVVRLGPYQIPADPARRSSRRQIADTAACDLGRAIASCPGCQVQHAPSSLPRIGLFASARFAAVRRRQSFLIGRATIRCATRPPLASLRRIVRILNRRSPCEQISRTFLSRSKQLNSAKARRACVNIFGESASGRLTRSASQAIDI